MKILIACEFSGIVRDAFTRRGFDATSCDLLPTEAPGKHIQRDVLDIIKDRHWDLMIAFPPCTYLCSSGLHRNKKDPDRQRKTVEALSFVRSLLEAPIQHIALENPIGCISTSITPHTQIVQPYMFGHDASKSTCLWLKNLPLLQPTKTVEGRRVGNRLVWGNQTPTGQNKLGPSPQRAKIRSKTYPGIAEAMADQWGRVLTDYRDNAKFTPWEMCPCCEDGYLCNIHGGVHTSECPCPPVDYWCEQCWEGKTTISPYEENVSYRGLEPILDFTHTEDYKKWLCEY